MFSGYDLFSVNSEGLAAILMVNPRTTTRKREITNLIVNIFSYSYVGKLEATCARREHICSYICHPSNKESATPGPNLLLSGWYGIYIFFLLANGSS